jgi:hypothetical protein
MGFDFSVISPESRASDGNSANLPHKKVAMVG